MAVKHVKQYRKSPYLDDWVENGIWVMIDSKEDFEEFAGDDFFLNMVKYDKLNAIEDYGAIFMNRMGGYHPYNPEHIKYEEI